MCFVPRLPVQERETIFRNNNTAGTQQGPQNIANVIPTGMTDAALKVLDRGEQGEVKKESK